MQEPEVPAVNISWGDARTFCEWLTERDRQMGKLGAGEEYRLPTDHEWSCADGIGAREDPAMKPLDKSDKIQGYPWGTQWPPPPGAGNFAGEEVNAVKTTPKWAGIEVAAGYRDDYPLLAPVGRFQSNPLGLFDMAGNAWQWCEDVLGTDERKRVTRVIRGGSWERGDALHTLSSHRSGNAEVSHFDALGFRCVLAPLEAAR
jgi:formylglycine-generating enzyme required for sulfatase activity